MIFQPLPAEVIHRLCERRLAVGLVEHLLREGEGHGRSLSARAGRPQLQTFDVTQQRRLTSEQRPWCCAAVFDERLVATVADEPVGLVCMPDDLGDPTRQALDGLVKTFRLPRVVTPLGVTPG